VCDVTYIDDEGSLLYPTALLHSQRGRNEQLQLKECSPCGLEVDYVRKMNVYTKLVLAAEYVD
jgi:hypothetical protein